MYNPKDFIPAKYKKNTDQVGDSSNDIKIDTKTDSPWSDLAKEPEVPEYRSSVTLDEKGIKNELTASNKIAELAEISQKQASSTNPKKKSKNTKKLTGLIIVLFLVIGVFASYFLTKQNQDLRQQASGCNPATEPYCSCYGNICYIDPPDDGCGEYMNKIDGKCMNVTCRKLANGNILCGFITDQDPCTEDSMGGDWCDDPNTSKTETCEEAGLMRCQCSGGWWTIGKADSCSDLCGDANANCPECPTTSEPTSPPRTPTTPKTPTPTPPPQPLACGEFNCVQNSDCQSGLTCQSVVVDGQDKKICSKGESQLFCATNPTTANCCESQPMPVCASIEMLDANNNLMKTNSNDDDVLEPGDKVRFRCNAVGNQDIDFNYEFRIWDTSTTSWANITDTSNTVAKNVSALYTIGNFGKHVVQGRICWGNDCQTWEIVAGAPSNSALCYGENAVACADGYVCSATPAGGCGTQTLDNGMIISYACASVPVCRIAEGINCQTNEDCFDGYTCYQPPMPTCPAGMSCAQVMPSKYCTK